MSHKPNRQAPAWGGDMSDKLSKTLGVPAQDLAGQGIVEDDRIETIGREAMQRGPSRKVAFLVDSDEVEPGKADRYIEKLKKRWPGIRILSKLAGPTKYVTTVIVSAPENAPAN